MRVAVWLLVLASCERGKSTEGQAIPPAVVADSAPAAAPILIDAAPPIDAVAAIPPELLAAPARVTRRVETGMAVQHHDAETFTLQIAGTQALLTVKLERGIAAKGDPLAVTLERWDLVSTTRLLGTATIRGASTKLALSDGTTPLALDCVTAKQAVAREGAVRVPHPPAPNTEGCGDEGRFTPGGLTKVDVLRCKLPEDFDRPRHFTDMPSLSFAAAPGIEWVYVNDDCAMQGGGWRRIAKDGSIAPVRDTKEAP